MKVNFQKARYVKSAPSVSAAPKDGLPQILFVGRSNVGKSSLINALTKQKLAFSSKKAGKTKLLNYFLIDEAFYLVDSPGYGSTDFATMSTIQFSGMMEDYVKSPDLKGIVLLLDLRRDPGKDDEAFYRYLVSSGKRVIPVLTKVDKMNQKEKAEAKKRALSLGLSDPLLSDLSASSNEKIRNAVASLL